MSLNEHLLLPGLAYNPVPDYILQIAIFCNLKNLNPDGVVSYIYCHDIHSILYPPCLIRFNPLLCEDYSAAVESESSDRRTVGGNYDNPGERMI